MSRPASGQHRQTQEDWSNDDDFDFDDFNDPSASSGSTLKPLLNVTSSDGRTVKMLSANVRTNVATPQSRTTYEVDREVSNGGIMASASSGSTHALWTKNADIGDLDMVEDDDDGYPTIKGLGAKSGSSTHGTGKSIIQSRVTGTALGGRAYITRLGSAGSHTNGKQHDSEMVDNLDWGNKGDQTSTGRSAASDLKNKLNLRLAKQHSDVPSRQDNWDDFDAGFSDEDDDARQTTLKAGAVTYNDISKHPRLAPSPAARGNTMPEAEDMEDGFQLPLTLQHLKLITRSPQSSSPVLRHRSSRSSLASAATGQTSDWDNIGTPGNARTRAEGSPSGMISRALGSVVPGTEQSEVDEQHAVNHVEDVQQSEDDLEDGLELPVPSFFSSGRTRELNRLLDQKRKPGLPRGPTSNEGIRYSSGTLKPSSTLMKPTLSSAAKLKCVPFAQDQIEDQLEDGLVLQDERTELTHGRLARIRQSRATTGTPTGPRNAAGGTLKRGFITGRQKVEAPVQKGDSLGRQYNPTRTVSGSNGLLATPSHSRTYTSTPSSPAPHALPSSSANTPNRLRHQKSHSRLGRAPPSPSLGKRQSMSSIREMAQLHEATGFSTYYPPTAVTNAPSYSAQTAASAARAAGKTRTSSNESDEWPSRAPSRTPSERSLAPRSASSTLNSGSGRMRPPIPTAFTHDALTDKSAPAVTSRLRKPHATKAYGDGTELDEIEDLQVDRAKEGMVTLPVSGYRSAGSSLGRSAGQHLGLGRPPRSNPPLETVSANVTAEKRKQHPVEPIPAQRQAATSRGKPIARKGLIRHLGKVEKKKVGDMIWNPETLRWEGNYQVLRDFDAQVMSSARPALITHYAAFANSLKTTSSSRSTVASGIDPAQSKGKMVESVASVAPPLNAARVVGNMMFDPDKMCWVSTLSAEEDEPDPFAGMDDEDSQHGGSSGFGDQDEHFHHEEEDELRGGTITRDMGKVFARGGEMMRFSSATTTTSSVSSAGTVANDGEPNGDRRRYQAFDRWNGEAGTLRKGQLRGLSGALKADQTDSGFKVKPFALRPTTYISEQLLSQSLAAEARHEREMVGWRMADRAAAGSVREVEREKRREEKRLWEIRHLAMRS